MQNINIISFLIFDLIIWGLAITAFRDLKVNSQMHNYWRMALVMFGTGYALFGVAPFIDLFFLTPANICVVAAFVATALLFRTWNTQVTKQLEISLLVAVMLLAGGFELVRNFGTFQQRVVLINVVLIACAIWHAYELVRLHKKSPVFFVKFLLVLSVLYIFFSASRIFIVLYGSDPTDISLYTENLWAFASRWGLMATDVLTYIAISGYYTEQSWIKEKEALNLQLSNMETIANLKKEINSAEQLNNDLVQVLNEKHKLLTNLSTSMKSSKMGAMASSLAHEINQPLTSIRLNAEVLLGEAKRQNFQEFIKDNLQYVINDADRIDGIVKKIRQFFNNDYSDFKPVNLAALVRLVVEFVEVECKEKQIDLCINVDPDLSVLGDQGQLQMVVFNLLNNAIDALETAESKRCISVESFMQDGHVSLCVSDNGIGVAHELKDRIFDLFRTSKTNGMGVGLWISRAVMENHRGELILDSEHDQTGARFVMQFNESNPSHLPDNSK
jgi:signal transduction histidine kinase